MKKKNKGLTKFTFEGSIMKIILYELSHKITIYAENLEEAKANIIEMLDENKAEWFSDAHYDLTDLDCDKDE